MTIPTPGPELVVTECASCTVPIDAGGDLCAFCADPPPPLDSSAVSAADYDLLAPVPLPPGADDSQVDDWEINEDGRPSRLVWSRPLPFDAPWADHGDGWGDTDVRIVVTQFPDGRIGDTENVDGPEVYVGMQSYSVCAARDLAAVLLAAADLAEQWLTNTQVVTR